MRQRGKYVLSAAALCLALGLAAYTVVAGSGEDAQQAYNRGVAALRKGAARTDRIELLKAVKADPQRGSARLLQAQALLELGDGPRGEEEIGRARELATGGASWRERGWQSGAFLVAAVYVKMNTD